MVAVSSAVTGVIIIASVLTLSDVQIVIRGSFRVSALKSMLNTALAKRKRAPMKSEPSGILRPSQAPGVAAPFQAVAPCLQYIGSFSRRLRERVGLPRAERVFRRRPPERGDRPDAGAVRGLDVQRRVADVGGLRRVGLQERERVDERLAIRLV